MKKILLLIAVCSFVAVTAKAQSSGNFTYGSNSKTERCVLNNDNTGKITGGQLCSLTTGGAACTSDNDCTASGAICFNPSGGTLTGQCVASSSGAACTSDSQCASPETCVIPSGAASGTCGVVCSGTACGSEQCIGGFSVGIKTSSGAGNVFVIRPSAVVGLLTTASVTKSSTGVVIGTSSALAGVDFSVDVSPAGSNANPVMTPNYPVTYASRFIQISTNLFNALTAACVTTTTTPGGGCYLTFSESTVSAHSFDWIASGLSSGQYNVSVNWTSSLGDFGIANSMTCVGPVNLTVAQNKVFNFNTVNSF